MMAICDDDINVDMTLKELNIMNTLLSEKIDLMELNLRNDDWHKYIELMQLQEKIYGLTRLIKNKQKSVIEKC